MTDIPADNAAPEAPLTPVEARILGALVEKEATTPDAYPLTENALVLACNQKSNREPVMDLTAGEVGHALRAMEVRKFVKSVHGARAQRWEHRFAAALSVTPKQQALLCTLMLRGPQTASELLARSERLARFDDLDDVRYTLERLASHEPPFVTNLGRGPGQREDRHMHLLCGAVFAEAQAPTARESGPARGDPARSEAQRSRAELEARVEALEEKMRELEQVVESLR